MNQISSLTCSKRRPGRSLQGNHRFATGVTRTMVPARAPLNPGVKALNNLYPGVHGDESEQHVSESLGASGSADQQWDDSPLQSRSGIVQRDWLDDISKWAPRVAGPANLFDKMSLLGSTEGLASIPLVGSRIAGGAQAVSNASSSAQGLLGSAAGPISSGLGWAAPVAALGAGIHNLTKEGGSTGDRVLGGVQSLGGTLGLGGKALTAAAGSSGIGLGALANMGAGTALTGGGAGLGTAAGAGAAATSAGAVVGAGLAGYGVGRLLDEGTNLGLNALGVGDLLDEWEGVSRPEDQSRDVSISGMGADAMTAADRAVSSLWADPSRPAYTQTLGWKLGEWLGI